MHPRVSIDQVCFQGATHNQFISHCRTMGAQNIVLSSPQLLLDGGLESARTALGDAALKVEAVNHPFAIYPNLADDTGKAFETLALVIQIGAQLQAKSIYLLTGGRGSLDWENAAQRFAALVAPCVRQARKYGMNLMIENAPMLYADIHIAHSLSDTIALAERADTGVCIELFFCWAEANLNDLFRRALPRCGLVQVSDYVLGDRSLPARAVPGDGVIPLERIIGDLLNAGYEGVFDIELIGPRIDAEGHLAATTRAAELVSEILTKLKA